MDYNEKDFGKILKGNALKMRRLMLKDDTDCMRVYDRNLEAFPVTVDLYGKYARITDYSLDGMEDKTREVCCDIASRMLYVQKDHVIFYHRIKRIGREQHELLNEESVVTTVKENGLVFTVDLSKRIDTGLFLDHAVTRQMVRENSRGLRVLNLFSYTGAFSVYAASGGAQSVVSIDLSGTYTQWAKRNLQDNGFPEELFPCVAMDAWKYINGAVSEGKKFDLIIFDPPCFSNSHKMDSDFDVQRDYLRWTKVLNVLLTDGGRLLFSNNLGSFQLNKRLIRGFEVREISSDVAAPGFSCRLGTARTWLLAKTEQVRLSKEDFFVPPEKKAVKKQQEEKMSEEEKKEDVVVAMETEQHEGAEAPKAKRTTKKSTKSTTAKTKKIAKESIEETENNPEVLIPVVKEAPVAEEAAVSATEKAPATEEVAVPATEKAPATEEVTAPATEKAPVAEEVTAPVVEDDVLSLDWSDDEPKTEKNEEQPEEDKRSVIDHAFKPRPYGEGREEKRTDSDDRKNGDENSSDNRDRRPSSGDRGGFGGDRDRRPSSGDRGGFGGDRDRRPSYGDRDRGGFGGDRDRRPSYGDRGGFGGDRDRRPSYGDRGGSSFGGDRDRRPSYGDRDRGGFGGDRDRRPSYGDRDRGGFGGDRDRRPSYGDRDRGGFGGDRDRRPSYGDRDRGGFGGDRDRRPSYGDRDRGGFGGDRDRRPSYGDRGGSSFGGDRDRRPSYGDRDRGGFGGDREGFKRPSRYNDSSSERRPFDGKKDDAAPKPYGFDKFRETKTRGQEEDTNSFFWLENKDKNGGDDK